MGRGIIENGLFRSERYGVEQRTSDPADHQEGERWIRTDLAPETDQIATYRFDMGSEVVDIPIYDTSATTENVEKVRRVQVDGELGFIPFAESGAAYPQWAMQHAGTRLGAHDALTASAIPDSVVNRWPIDEGSGTTFADAAGTADGEWFGGAWVDDSTYIGDHGYSLDGADDYGDTGATMPADSLTLLATVDFSSDKSTIQYIHGTQDGGNAGGRFIRFADSATNRVQFELINDDGIFDANYDLPSTGRYRVAGILDASVPEIRIAVDGTVQNTTAVTGTFSTQLSNHKVGRRPDGTEGYYGGEVDEPMIANEAYTSSQLQDDYDRQPWS